MKKILSLLLCLVLTCAVLVSCDEPQIGDGTKDYPQTVEKVERLDLNMYIITGDSTTDNAIKTVKSNISNHTKTTYNTVLNVFYVSESAYESTVLNAIEQGGENAPHIILINSESLVTNLMAENKLADLTDYFLSSDFGMLNTQITSSLINASKFDSKLYTVPNNRVVGEYSYLVIDKEMARDTLKYKNRELMSYTSLEDAADLIADIAAIGKNPDDYVKIVNGSYGLRDELATVTVGEKVTENFVNVISTPVVTSAEAFESAFAIVNTEEKYNDRAMQMIYAINNDIELRNLLQYGFSGSNYITEKATGNIVLVKDGINNYEMNLIYTGDVFKAYNCSEISWTNTEKAYGLLQNNDSKAEAK